MLALIKREIEDNRVFFIAAIILAVIFSVLFVYQQYNRPQVSSKSHLLGIAPFEHLCWLGIPLRI